MCLAKTQSFMKNTFSLLLSLALLTFGSCKEEQGGEEVVQLTSQNIQGTWRLTTFSNDGTRSVAGQPEPFNSTISNSTVTITFSRRDINPQTFEQTFTSTGDYTVTINTAEGVETEERTGGIGNGSYTLAGGVLTLTNIDIGDEADTDILILNVESFQLDNFVELQGETSFSTDIVGVPTDLDYTTNMRIEK